MVSATSTVSSLQTIPQEVLEHIAFFSATSEFLGPPAGIASFLLTCRKLHSSLSVASNPHLYARIFCFKFDGEPALRRLGSSGAASPALAHELERRCFYLKRIRARLDCTTSNNGSQYLDKRYDQEQDPLHHILWMSYMMMIENDGKNERQLREYGRMDEWLKDYWFNVMGASLATRATSIDRWPQNNEHTSLGMWLFWFFLIPEDFVKNESMLITVTNMTKLMAQGAHQYPLCSPNWAEFVPRSHSASPPISTITHYSHKIEVIHPPISIPAILSYLTLLNNTRPPTTSTPHVPLVNPSSYARQSLEWESIWHRCLGAEFGQDNRLIVSGAFCPGTLEGVWEGIFSYTEFTAYAALLSGAPPVILHNSLVAQHRQTWKLREHHLLYYPSPASSPTSSPSSSSSSSSFSAASPLLPGDPLRAWLPPGIKVQETSEGVEVWEPGRAESVKYTRLDKALERGLEGINSSLAPRNKNGGRKLSGVRSRDVIITGEGHSAWGQFQLIGRIRPTDGLISLSKEYMDGDRGKWLYRGHIVGNMSGNFAGRWRDTLSPPHVPGYEGCYAMSRRR
ncbi:hypothetical protein JAAARDRAFT_36742 [Jaapia argillacea MUCL 33604]|uniref:F-box domain-containing protein n=1 Tax=Jaapia argillacea MUCL 33604 TaxID=933084 RepID=A0A067PMC5_9AGAM|nr:hypothetical protein JAAARDRAFT_36742 [Jaapia argillacea MUCL 33604]